MAAKAGETAAGLGAGLVKAATTPIYSRKKIAIWDDERGEWVPVERETEANITPAAIGTAAVALFLGAAAIQRGLRTRTLEPYEKIIIKKRQVPNPEYTAWRDSIGPAPPKTITITQTYIQWVRNPEYDEWLSRGGRGGQRPPETIPVERTRTSVVTNPAYAEWLKGPTGPPPPMTVEVETKHVVRRARLNLGVARPYPTLLSRGGDEPPTQSTAGVLPGTELQEFTQSPFGKFLDWFIGGRGR